MASSPFASSAVSADVGLGMEALLPGLVDMRGLQSEVCTQNLRDAINAALSEIIGLKKGPSGGWDVALDACRCLLCLSALRGRGLPACGEGGVFQDLAN